MKTIFTAWMLWVCGSGLVWASPWSGTEMMTGRKIQIPSMPDRVTVVTFLSARCPCSRSHEAELKRLHGVFSGTGIEFVGVHSNQDETSVETKKHFRAAALPFPIISDQGAKLADAFRALKTPHVFIVKGGEVVFQGGVDDSADGTQAKKHFLEEALTALKSGKPLETTRVRTLGCAIRRQ